MIKVLVPIADGSEEMEAVIIVDTFRRAGWEVDFVGINEGEIVASRGVKIVPDKAWNAIDSDVYDIIALPGGNGGTENLMNDDRVLEALRKHHAKGRLTAAVCAGPLVLQRAGIIDDTRVTCHPAAASKLTRAVLVEESVVVADNVVTSRGPGTTFSFALTIIALAEGRVKAEEIADGMMLNAKSAT